MKEYNINDKVWAFSPNGDLVEGIIFNKTSWERLADSEGWIMKTVSYSIMNDSLIVANCSVVYDSEKEAKNLVQTVKLKS